MVHNNKLTSCDLLYISYGRSPKSRTMQFARTCIVNRHIAIFSDFLRVCPKLCLLSTQRHYGVVSCSSRGVCRFSASELQCTSVRLSSGDSSHYAVNSDVVTDTESNDVLTHQSDDVNCLDSDSSILHNPVLAEKVVNLISPVKGQVRVFLLCFPVVQHVYWIEPY